MKVSSVYEVGLEIHNELKRSFLEEGKTVRQLALEHGLQPMQILNFMRWAAREYDIERRMRADSLCGALFALSKDLLETARREAQKGDVVAVDKIAAIVDRVHKMHQELSQATEEWQQRILARKRGKKSGTKRAVDDRKPGESDADMEDEPFDQADSPEHAFDTALDTLDGASDGALARRS